ncbi:MAG: lamin tail domain-containing protein [Methanotrichaceae archaeon]|nr:lamin tail domain-containing protein [Methanotrichaceae archaeon]
MKKICITLCIAAIFLLYIGFFGDTGIAQTPSQQAFDLGIIPTMPGSITPMQQAFEVRGNQTTLRIGTGTPTQQTFELRGSQVQLGTETPTQLAFGLHDNQELPETQANLLSTQNVTIFDIAKDGTALLVRVSNNMMTPIDLAGWKLVLNNGTAAFTFPSFTLLQNASITVHANIGANTQKDLFGSNFIWNGTSDIELLNDRGTLVSEYRIAVPLMENISI